MKKGLLIVFTTLLLIGCAQAPETQISNKDDVIVTVNGKSITKGDVYTMMSHQDISSDIVNLAKDYLVDSKVEVTEELKKEAQKFLAEQKELLGEFFKTYYGELTDEELLEEYFIPAQKQVQLMKAYFDANKDAILEANKPLKYLELTFDTQEKAEQALTRIKANEDIKKVVEELGTKGANYQFEATVGSTSTIPAIVSEYLKSDEAKQLTWIKTPLKDTTTQKYLLIKTEELDSKKLMDEYRDVFASEAANIDKVFTEEFKNEDFRVYDQAIYDSIISNKELVNFKPNN
ncbi:MAG: hypothetical protein GXY98_01915 [Erysipelothrix sp.]|nr:hypothetical protein [Erysipelothrix sp.]